MPSFCWSFPGYTDTPYTDTQIHGYIDDEISGVDATPRVPVPMNIAGHGTGGKATRLYSRRRMIGNARVDLFQT